MTSSAEDLMQRVLSGKFDGFAAAQLLDEFHKGYPIKHILSLLNQERSAWVGVWIASELGMAARPLLGEVVRFLRASDRRTRANALGVVLLCAGTDDSSAIVDAASLVLDDDSAVRTAAIDFLGRLSTLQLNSAASTDKNDSELLQLIRWLSHSSSMADDAITNALMSARPIERRFAAAAAIRRPGTELSVLLTTIDDRDIDIREAISARLGVSVDERVQKQS